MINLESFCGSDVPSRYNFGAPFVRDGVIYYTDGRVGVAMPTDLPDSPPPVPDGMANVFRQPVDAALAWPVIDIESHQRMAPCPDCGGKRGAKCIDCNGTGEVMCPHCEQDMDCEECDGTGEVKCDCDGKPYRQFRRVQIGDAWVNAGYAWLIGQLPCVKYSEPSRNKFGGWNPIRFIFDGGWGVLMPIMVQPGDDEWCVGWLQCKIDLALEVSK